MTPSDTQSEERKPWVYAFLILLLASLCMLTMRLMNTPILALDFEVALVYLPTALAGLITFQMGRKRRVSGNLP